MLNGLVRHYQTAAQCFCVGNTTSCSWLVVRQLTFMLYRFTVRERHCSPAIVAAFYCCETPRLFAVQRSGNTARQETQVRVCTYSGTLRRVKCNQYYIF